MKRMINYIESRILTWLYTVGMVAGLCLMGSEAETLKQTVTGGVLGLVATIIFAVLLAGELESHE